MLKNINFSLLFIAILLARITFKGANIGDSIAVAALSALHGYGQYLKSKKEIIVNADIKRDIELLKSSVDSLKIARAMSRHG